MKLCTGNDTESVENEDEQRSQHNATSPFLRLPLEIKAIIHKTVCGNRPSISTRTIGHMRSTTMMTIHITASKPISGIIQAHQRHHTLCHKPVSEEMEQIVFDSPSATWRNESKQTPFRDCVAEHPFAAIFGFLLYSARHLLASYVPSSLY